MYQETKRDLDEAREKSRAATGDRSRETEKLQSALDAAQEDVKGSKTRMRLLEQENDDLSRRVRELTAELDDVREKHETIVENNVWLQGELDEMKEAQQRLRDELRDAQSEVAAKALAVERAAKGEEEAAPAPQAAPAPAEDAGEAKSPQAIAIVNDMLSRVRGLEQRLAACVTVCRDILPDDFAAKA